MDTIGRRIIVDFCTDMTTRDIARIIAAYWDNEYGISRLLTAVEKGIKAMPWPPGSDCDSYSRIWISIPRLSPWGRVRCMISAGMTDITRVGIFNLPRRETYIVYVDDIAVCSVEPIMTIHCLSWDQAIAYSVNEPGINWLYVEL